MSDAAAHATNKLLPPTAETLTALANIVGAQIPDKSGSQPVGMDKDVYLSNWEALNAAVHEIVLDLGGSISAEHGIGRMKRELLPHAKGAVAMELMRLIKTSFDPNGILNPGKLL